MRMLAVSILVLCLGCASLEVEGVPYCGDSTSLPLAGAECDGEELALLREALQPVLEKDVGSAIVRAEFDAQSAISRVCVEREYVSDEWITRQALTKRLTEIENLPAGPACVANQQLRFNRREAILARIKRADQECKAQIENSAAMQRNVSMATSQVLARDRSQCLAFKANWIILDRRRAPDLIFVEPEAGPSPLARPVETMNRCTRVAHDFESQVECIQSDGWEILP